jgi:hypothetical protein
MADVHFVKHVSETIAAKSRFGQSKKRTCQCDEQSYERKADTRKTELNYSVNVMNNLMKEKQIREKRNLTILSM